MKKQLLLIAAVCLASLSASAQLSTAQYANSSTGTTLNTLTKIVVNATVPQAQIAATTDTQGVIGITTDGAGTSGKPTITYSGIAPCVFSNTVVANDFVQISPTTAGNCLDAGLTRPTSGQIIGVVAQTGGAAGTYNVLLDKSILPSSSSATAPLCQPLGSSDTLSAAGTFATTCPVPTSAISGAGQTIEVRAHGTYTTGATASPILILQVNGGGTSPICSHSSNNALGLNQTSSWDLVCFIHIATTGAPGTAWTWGYDEANTTAGGSSIVSKNFTQAATVSFTTNSTQTISIQETATMVSGESATLTGLIVRNY